MCPWHSKLVSILTAVCSTTMRGRSTLQLAETRVTFRPLVRSPITDTEPGVIDHSLGRSRRYIARPISKYKQLTVTMGYYYYVDYWAHSMFNYLTLY